MWNSLTQRIGLTLCGRCEAWRRSRRGPPQGSPPPWCVSGCRCRWSATLSGSGTWEPAHEIQTVWMEGLQCNPIGPLIGVLYKCHKSCGVKSVSFFAQNVSRLTHTIFAATFHVGVNKLSPEHSFLCIKCTEQYYVQTAQIRCTI